MGRNPLCIAYSIGSTRRLIGHITTLPLMAIAVYLAVDNVVGSAYLDR